MNHNITIMLLFLLKLFTFYVLVKKISEVTNKMKIMFLSAVNNVSILCFSSNTLNAQCQHFTTSFSETCGENSWNITMQHLHYFTVAFLRLRTEGVFKYSNCTLKNVFYVVCTMIKFFLVTAVDNPDFCPESQINYLLVYVVGCLK